MGGWGQCPAPREIGANRAQQIQELEANALLALPTGDRKGLLR